MKQDRFLLGILVFIALLIVAALALFFVRKDVQTSYGAEDTPSGVIRNYTLALHKRDYARSYGYLADKENKPDFDAFRRLFLANQLNISSAALKIGSVTSSSESEALVEVTVLHASGGPFSEGWSSTETVTLLKQNGAWKITYMPHPYWFWDWYQPNRNR